MAAAAIAARLPRLRAQSVDPDFLVMWEAAQQARPDSIGVRSRIAPTGEPGEPLLIRGRLLASDETTPVAGAIVFAHQTDRDGHYDRPGRGGWRLKGWARTGDDGRFEFDTIRPGAYPGHRIAAHVHLGVDGPPGRRHLLPDVLFEGDRLLTRSEVDRSARAGAFANVRPVRLVAGGPVVEILYRLPGEFVF